MTTTNLITNENDRYIARALQVYREANELDDSDCQNDAVGFLISLMNLEEGARLVIQSRILSELNIAKRDDDTPSVGDDEFVEQYKKCDLASRMLIQEILAVSGAVNSNSNTSDAVELAWNSYSALSPQTKDRVHRIVEHFQHSFYFVLCPPAELSHAA